MQEIELKFQVGAAQRQALERAVETATAQRVSLRASYFDTADRRLARAGLALRVRKEGRRWVQTLKGSGDGLWQRLEHEVPLAARATPQVDPLLHANSPAGDALHDALGDGVLQPLYRTEVTRIKRLLRAPGCVVELAFDRGALLAGQRRWALCELEFELKSGTPQAMAALAARWAARFALTLDVRSKAERGERLARGACRGAAVKAQPMALPEAVHAAAAVRLAVGNCLRQILGNASELAHGVELDADVDAEPDAASDAVSDAEQLHQLRVGLRRLRTVLRELGPLAQGLSPSWDEAATSLFRSLGAARDRDALEQSLLPALRRAGAQGLKLPATALPHDALAPLRAVATTRLWLQLLAFAAGSDQGNEAAPQPFDAAAAQRLGRLFKQVCRDAARYATLDDGLRHRLRKRVKRLRYLSEFAAPAFRARRVRGFLKRLTPAQEALGAFNDVCVARSLFDGAAGADSTAMFALGWLAHERDDAIVRCTQALARLRRAEPFWR